MRNKQIKSASMISKQAYMTPKSRPSNGCFASKQQYIKLSSYLSTCLSILAIASLASGQSNPFAAFEGGRFGSANRFAFEPPEGFALAPPPPNASDSLSWRPLRATFRPFLRPVATTAQPSTRSALADPPLALIGAAEEAAEREREANDNFRSLGARLESIFPTVGLRPAGQPQPPPPTQPPVAATTVTPTIAADLEDDLPTRVPLSRFRPTQSPSDDREPGNGPQASNLAASRSAESSPTGGNPPPLANQPRTSPPPPSLQNSPRQNQLQNDTSRAGSSYEISSECFECICEASTSCNIQSRCQTSDVRHTRCGLFLLSYAQWLESGLSKKLVTAEQLSRDVAADERAFYECSTNRDCAERLIVAYMAKNGRDCDRDGRIDCYDIAAIHQGGTDQCNGEALLESQYWSDFNACYGFSR